MKILFIGAGKMGGAWLRKLSKKPFYDSVTDIRVIEPLDQLALEYKNHKKISFHKNEKELESKFQPFQPDISVIAIKPQLFPEILINYSRLFSNSLILSIAAGKKISDIAQYTYDNQRIVRIMPNMGMQVGESVNLLYARENISSSDKNTVTKLLEPTGMQYWLEEEELIDIMTPITGCGPAYFYQLCEEMTQILINQGIQEKDARMLVQATFKGSAIYSGIKPNFSQYVTDVSSKGGVTEALMSILKPGLHHSIENAYKHAIERLGKLNDTYENNH